MAPPFKVQGSLRRPLPQLLVWVAMGCVLALTLGLWFLVRQADRQRSEARSQALGEAVEGRIKGRLTGLSEMLQGAAGDRKSVV